MKLPPSTAPERRGRSYSQRYHDEGRRHSRSGNHGRSHDGRNYWEPYWHPWYGYSWYGRGNWWNPYRNNWYYPSYYYRSHNRWFRFGFGYSNYWRWCPYVSWYYPGCYYDSYAYYPYYTYCLGYPYNRYVYVGSGPVGDTTVIYNYGSSTEEWGDPGEAAPPGPVADEGAGGAIGSLPETAPPAPARVLSGAEYFLRLGDDAFVVGDYAKAADAYRQAVKSDPESAVARFALAEALLASGEYHQAAYSIREGLKRDPKWVESDLDRRILFPSLKAFRSVQADLDRYVAANPFDATAHFVHGYARFFSEERDLARTSFQEVLRLQTEDGDVQRFLDVLDREPETPAKEKPRGELVQAEAEVVTPSGS